MASVRDVTILIPLYIKTEDHLDWAEECVSSAVGQGCHVLLVDDGSPIDPREKLSQFADTTTLFMNEHNGGVSRARNQAARNAHTELILPLDADDYLIPGAVEHLVQAWAGVPVYPDLAFIGDKLVPHYELKDFSCEQLQKTVGLAPVTVLHSKEQWQKIGGWNEDIPLYEDGEYNARLFAEFCALHLSKPLLAYRQHLHQRSKHTEGAAMAREVHQRYILSEVLAMARGCCGGSKKSNPTVQSSKSTIKSSTDAQGRPIMFHNTPTVQGTPLPGAADDRIRAKYVGGKGKGPHYYKGPGTNFRYKVVHGGEYHVDPSDAVTNESGVGLGAGRSLFVALEQKEAAPARKFQAPDEEPVRKARVNTAEKTPVVEEEDLPDISNMTVAQIRDANFSPEVAEQLLEDEKAGKDRSTAKYHLKKAIDG